MSSINTVAFNQYAAIPSLNPVLPRPNLISSARDALPATLIASFDYTQPRIPEGGLDRPVATVFDFEAGKVPAHIMSLRGADEATKLAQSLSEFGSTYVTRRESNDRSNVAGTITGSGRYTKNTSGYDVFANIRPSDLIAIKNAVKQAGTDLQKWLDIGQRAAGSVLGKVLFNAVKDGGLAFLALVVGALLVVAGVTLSGRLSGV
jgi:hypothetical protein